MTFILAIAACQAGDPGAAGPSFEIRRVDVGVRPASVAILDHDADGATDLLVSGDGRLIVLRGDGSGEFRIHETVDAGDHPVDFAAADLDHDRRLDVVVANHETRHVTLLFGGPDGFESGRQERFAVDVSPHPHAVAVSDLDGDGHPDFVVDDRDRERLRVYRGSGDGSFEAGRAISVGGDPYRGLALHDVDGDGHVDVLTPNPRAVAIQLGDGRGDFSPGPRLESGDVPPFGVAVGEFNGDGVPDVAAGSREGRGAVALWWGTPDGGFERSPGSPYAIADGPVTLATGDVDGDGVEDVLATSYVGNELAILAAGSGSVRVSRVELADNPWGVAVGDLNRDGRTDVVTADNGAPRISVLLAR